MKKFLRIFQNAIPVLVMLGLIYLVPNDFVLTGIYVALITIVLVCSYEKLDFTALILGIVIMTCGELLFIGSGVEVFTRQSLFGVMPLWLPILWGYCFVAIKRAVNILKMRTV